MKTKSINDKGCSVCEAGTENYTTFRPAHRPKQTYFQYDYRHTDGDLYSTVASTLEQCRRRRDEWLNKKAEKYVLFIGFKRLGEFDTILEAKKYADNSGLSGVFNLLGKDNYRDSWYAWGNDK